MNFIRDIDSPIGPLTLASDGESLTGLWMEGQKYYGLTLADEREKRDVPVFDVARRWLDRYFAGKKPAPDIPLAPRGSLFRREVWAILLAIPYGEVTTYGEIGKRIAALRGRASMSAQAVGGAVGHNPISVIIPCHRVIGSDGGLTGFAGGLEKKRFLLRLENAPVEGFGAARKGDGGSGRLFKRS